MTSKTKSRHSVTPKSRHSARAHSVRTRWNRSIAVLALVVFTCALVTFFGTRLLLETSRESAVAVERDSTASVQLKADIISSSIIATSPISGQPRTQAQAAQRALRESYEQALDREPSTRARQYLTRSFEEWQALMAETAPEVLPATREAAVEVRLPAVLALLDQAGSTSRQAVRADLDDAASRQRVAIVGLALLELLAMGLAVRLAWRLSNEVLRPVGILRDSANRLATGDLDHRVVMHRADELGDLAVSINAIAESLAGSRRSLAREVTTDSLSGLANRAAFGTRLHAALARPQRRSGDQAVLFAGLDDFKDVNDTLGYAAGDELLKVVAQRLVNSVRPADLVARLGGDEFAILLDGLAESGMAMTVADRIVVALAEPVPIGSGWVDVAVSVGMAVRRSESTAEQMMREADVAMYTAKAKGKNRIERYDAGLDDVAMARQLLRRDLAHAVERGEFAVDYQPVINLHTGGVLGMEALVRWHHPVRGLLPPSSFIDLAEETGDIVAIGAWVLATAAGQLQVWQRRYDLPDLWVSVNVSMRQLDAPGFADDVTGMLLATSLNPASLVVEVTESILADPRGEAAAGLAALRKLGIRVALDDFGTGFSSISYLRQLPVDIIKIDRSFTVDANRGDAGNALLSAIVAMARHLDLGVIPEGIEEVDQLEQLRALGCHMGQGFLLSRPRPADTIEAMLAWPLPDMRLYTVPNQPVGPGREVVTSDGRTGH